MKSVMKHAFSQIPRCEIPRSVFDRSHGHITTFAGGYLVPFFVDEALPGDTMQMRASLFLRMTTAIVPCMDNLHLETFFFAVPYRLLWENWERFNGAQDNPGDPTDFLCPSLDSPAVTGWTVGSLEDAFGLPTGIPNLAANTFHHRAYNKIWNEWFRDENLQDSLTVPMGDTDDLQEYYVLRRRGKRHDYFTSCLPWPQKGPGVDIPIGTTVPVYGSGRALGFTPGAALDAEMYGHHSGANTSFVSSESFSQPLGTTVTPTTLTDEFHAMGVPTKEQLAELDVGPGDPWQTWSGLQADLSESSAVTINALRQAVQLPRCQPVFR